LTQTDDFELNLEKGIAARETLETSLTTAGFFYVHLQPKFGRPYVVGQLTKRIRYCMSFYGRARARQICVTYVFTQNIPEKDDSKKQKHANHNNKKHTKQPRTP
jgi:hypothetical protein